jgi:diguanylate cyclase (GGDEF)-like protein
LFIVPLAREAVLETMPDGVLVFDPLNRLLDYNPAARDILQLPMSAVGKPSIDSFNEWKGIVNQLEKDEPVNEIKVKVDDWTFNFKSMLSLITDKSGTTIGKTILLHDITQEVLLMEQLTQLANSDDLTDLPNRRRFFEMAESEIARAKRYNHPLSLALMNIDNFTAINDQYGYNVGDLALKTIALLCSQSLRTIDVVARYGGAIFVILFPETKINQACTSVARLYDIISQISIPVTDKDLHIIVRFGVSGTEQSEFASLDQILVEAETALNQAKKKKHIVMSSSGTGR